MTAFGRTALACGLALLAPAAPGRAEDRFRVLSAESASSLARQVSATHADGFRLRASAQGTGLNGRDRIIVLMERSADAADYAYAVVRTSADFDSAVGEKSVNEWAADGYRLARENLLARRIEDWWVPESSYDGQVTMLLERAPRATPRRYVSLAITTREQIRRSLAEQVAAGHDVIGMWNAGRALNVVIEQRTAATPRPAGSEAYRLLIGDNKLGFEEQLARMALAGYRVVDIVDQSIKAPPFVLVRYEPLPEGTFEYVLMFNPDRKIYRDKLEKKLNKKGKLGYRVAARAVTSGVVAFERAPDAPRPVRFLALSSKEPPGLPRALEDAMARDYRFLALLTYADETIAVVEQSPP